MFYSFLSYIVLYVHVYNPLCFNFCEKCYFCGYIYYYYFACGWSIIPAPFAEKTIFSSQIAFNLLWKISWLYFCEYISWDLYSVPLTYEFIILPIPYYHDYCDFIVSLKIGSCESSKSFLFFSIVLSILSLFAYLYKFWNHFVNIYKIAFGYFDWDCIKSIGQFEKNWHLSF